ncbi:hypothetical protein VNO78_04761 [Psophocarpus tetragonolobus]|uniref:Uncharacterized protein n=1 Tax=Psophocarpus tetragonolobus TaxID=3891 RepID=A0AAN9XWG2_PSOTE
MPRPQELPGFYYDPEKNRYFPIKGPIPGSSSKPKTPTLKSPETSFNQARELDGHPVVASRYSKCNFAEEFRKIQAAKPVVWKYQGTDKLGISALEQFRVDVQTSEGQTETDLLLTGSIQGSISLLSRLERGETWQLSQLLWSFQQTAGTLVEFQADLHPVEL